MIQRGMRGNTKRTCRCATPLLVQRDRDETRRGRARVSRLGDSPGKGVRSVENIFLSRNSRDAAFYAPLVSPNELTLVSHLLVSSHLSSYIVKRHDTLSLSLIFGTDSRGEQCDRGVTYSVTVVLDYDE